MKRDRSRAAHRDVRGAGLSLYGEAPLSEVLWWLAEKDTAKRLFREAEELKKRFTKPLDGGGGLFAWASSAEASDQVHTSNPATVSPPHRRRALVPRTALRVIEDDRFWVGASPRSPRGTRPTTPTATPRGRCGRSRRDVRRRVRRYGYAAPSS